MPCNLIPRTSPPDALLIYNFNVTLGASDDKFALLAENMGPEKGPDSGGESPRIAGFLHLVKLHGCQDLLIAPGCSIGPSVG